MDLYQSLGVGGLNPEHAFEKKITYLTVKENSVNAWVYHKIFKIVCFRHGHEIIVGYKPLSF